MTVSHILFNDQTTHGRLLRRALQQQEEGLQNLIDVLATMQLMIDGDGSDSAQFPYVTTRFGFTNDAGSKAAWDELNSLKYKLTTNNSVSDVNAALLQVFNKFR